MSKLRLFQPLRLGMIIAFVLLVFGIHSTSASPSQADRSATGEISQKAAVDTGPFGAALYDDVRPGYSHTLFDVKFLDDSNIQASGDRVAGLSAADTAALDAVSRMYSVVAVTPVFTAPKPELDRTRERGELMSGEALPDLSTWMRYEIASAADAEAFIKAMRSLDSVYSIEPAALPSPPPAVTPNFSGNQGYLTPANVGIDALYSWGLTGGDGTGITIFDVEYDWNQTHEDLSKINGLPLLVNAGDSNNSPFDKNHGTAVIGEVAGDDNGIGVTGISKGAGIGLAPTVTTNLGFNPANAINLATGAAVPGDVILIEQQATVCGLPSGSYGPQEWINTVYSAIQTATANGIVVVEAAGNGNVNLDQAACGTTFNRSVRDSGAIIVGAGGTGGSNLQRLTFSSYGSRLDLQGWGQNVMTTGYGSFYTNPDDPTNPNYFYTSTFNGTSSASPIVTGAVANVQGIAKNHGGVRSPSSVRTLLVQTGTAQLPNEAQKIGPRPNLAQAIAQILLPEINVVPTSFNFVVPAGATDSDIMNIANLGNANLDWNISVHTGGTAAVGDWTLYFDWGCTGSPGIASLILKSDFTFTDNYGGSGTWSQTDNQLTWNYLVGGDAVYSGYIAGAAMAGTMSAGVGSGCWEASHNPPPATVQNGERTPSGAMAENAGATVNLPAAAALERVDIASLLDRSSEQEAAPGAPWLNATPANGTVPGGNSDPVTIDVDSNVYVAGEYGLLVVHSNDGDEATIAVPVSVNIVYAPEIEVVPTSMDFVVPAGSTDNDILDIGNVGSANLDWTVNWYTGAVDVIGDWTYYFDWGCSGSPGSTVITYFPDFTWMANTGETGPWTLVDNYLVLTYPPTGVTYSGYVAGDHIAGTSFLPPSTPGCFEAERVVSPIVSLVPGERTFTGSPAAEPGEVTELHFDASGLEAAPGAPWLNATPANGTVPAGSSDPVTVGVDSNVYVTGEYGLLVVHSNDGDEATIAVPVTMAVEVNAEFSGTPTTGPAPLTVNFSNLSSGDYDTCTWDFGDSSGSSSCANPTHTYTAPGYYTVELTASGLGGSDSEIKFDYIKAGYWLYLPIILH